MIIKANTNNSQGFIFTSNEDDYKTAGIYLEQSLLPTLKNLDWKKAPTVSDDELSCLYSQSFTDVLLVGLKDLNQKGTILNLNDGHLRTEIQAMWDSFSEILVKGISLREDIEPSELSSGKKIITTFSDRGNPMHQWVSFITDMLDNGAGYSSYYSNPKNFADLVNYIEEMIVPELTSDDHSNSCTSSCYLCLRNYFNRNNHSALDWRLGVDLFYKIKNKSNDFSLKSKWWKTYIENVLYIKVNELLHSENVTRSEINGVEFFKFSNIVLVPLHPVFDPNSSECIKDLIDLKAASKASQAAYINLYEFERSPMAELRKCILQTRGNT